MKVRGAWRITPAEVKEMANKYVVSERQVYLDIKNVIKNIPKPKVDEAGKKFLISWEYAIDKAIELMRNENPEICAKGIKLYFEAVDNFTKFMENYGFKKKVPDEIRQKIVFDYEQPDFMKKEGADGKKH